MKNSLINKSEPEELDPAAQETPAEEELEQESPEADEGAGEAVASGDLSPEGVRNKLEIPDNLKDAYDRIVVAGMKVMFDKSTHEMALKAMQGDGPVEQRLAQGIAGLMGMLVEKSNKTMPPQLVIPAGIELLAAAADFIKQSGSEPIEDQQIGEAMALFVQLILEQSGVTDPAKMQAMLQGDFAEEGAPPAAPQPGGLINQQAEA
jgi:hypothetical protein